MSDWVIAEMFALTLVTVIMAATLRAIPKLDELVLGGETRRIHTLDGMRGVLSIIVILVHCLVMIRYSGTGILAGSTALFETQIGEVAVALFFMLSSYLFGGDIVRRRGEISLRRFAVGRVLRIVPAYLVALAFLFIYVAIESRFVLQVPLQSLAKQIVRWSLFDFVYTGPINGIEHTKFMLGQIWTLHYEWMLYISLAVFAWAIRKTGRTELLYVGLIAGMIFWDARFAFMIAGAAGIELARFNSVRARQIWQATGVLGLLIVLFRYTSCTDWRQALLLTPLFVAVLQGHRAFALIGSRSFRFIGEISLSLYLLHTFVIWALAHWLIGFPRYATLTPGELVAVMIVASFGSIAVATVSFVLVERPANRWRPTWLNPLYGPWPHTLVARYGVRRLSTKP